MRQTFGGVLAPGRATEVVFRIDGELPAMAAPAAEVVFEELYRPAAMRARDVVYVLRLPKAHILTGASVLRHFDFLTYSILHSLEQC